jgi:4-amino-4-deoxy-L-arabinose transferase-like glycosyltransferase
LRTAAALAGLFVLTSVAWYATTFARFPSGFTTRYYPNAVWTVPPVLTTIDERVDGDLVRRTWTRIDEPFGVRWEGYLLLDRSAECRFSVLSTGSTRLLVDDRVVLDGDVPWRRQVTTTTRLTRGVHSVVVEYVSRAGLPDIQVFWATSGMDRLVPLAGRVVSPRAPPGAQPIVTAIVVRARVLIVFLWTAGYICLLLRVVTILMRHLVRHHLPDGVPTETLALVALVAAVYGVGITWGVPGPGWAPDEILPADLGSAIDTGFAHGWWSKYPPVHYLLCALAGAPLFVWRWLDPGAYGASAAPDVLLVIFRLVSVAMGAGIVLMVYICGRYIYGHSPSLLAAAVAALTMPAVQYGKLANVDIPYTFWFSVSLASFARLAVQPARVDYLVFAAAGALAICTKDQAYGLYGLPALALLVRWPRRWRDVLAAAAITAAVVLIGQNLLWNWQGFVSHVQFITSPGAAPFRMFDSSATGQWRLWRTVWMLMRFSMGWPAFLLCASGLLLSLVRPALDSRRLWWLLLPALSYHVTFLGVVGYTYDRFLLPVMLPIALAGGFCASRLEDLASIRWPARAIVAGLLAYSFVYVMAVNVALLRDSRYAVEDWMRGNIEPGATIGLVGPIEHLPRIDGWYTESVDPTVDVIQSLGFEYLVVNAEWAQRFGPERLQHRGYRELRDGHLKYRPAFESHNAIGFAGLSLDARLDQVRAAGYTTLTKLNPPTIVYRREGVSPGTPAPTARRP